MTNVIRQADILIYFNQPTKLKRKNIGLFNSLTVLKNRDIIRPDGTINREGNNYMFIDNYVSENKRFYIFSVICVLSFICNKLIYT